MASSVANHSEHLSPIIPDTGLFHTLAAELADDVYAPDPERTRCHLGLFETLIFYAQKGHRIKIAAMVGLESADTFPNGATLRHVFDSRFVDDPEDRRLLKFFKIIRGIRNFEMVMPSADDRTDHGKYVRDLWTVVSRKSVADMNTLRRDAIRIQGRAKKSDYGELAAFELIKAEVAAGRVPIFVSDDKWALRNAKRLGAEVTTSVGFLSIAYQNGVPRAVGIVASWKQLSAELADLVRQRNRYVHIVCDKRYTGERNRNAIAQLLAKNDGGIGEHPAHIAGGSRDPTIGHGHQPDQARAQARA